MEKKKPSIGQKESEQDSKTIPETELLKSKR
jgi:hypothetical protein